MSNLFDVVIVGAGAAGLFCAGVAGQRGLRVLLIDHAPKVAEKIRISGGGRCNFTNREVGPGNFLSENPHFSRSALSGYSPQDFLALVQSYRIAWHEKHRGQLFCDHKADDIIQMLLSECCKGGVTRWQPCTVHDMQSVNDDNGCRFELHTSQGAVRAAHLVLATGGLSIPKIGATDFGQRWAERWGHTIVPMRPALVPLTFAPEVWAPFAGLAGVSLEVHVQTEVMEGGKRPKTRSVGFIEDLLFTHRGLSGPAVLQISSHWRAGHPLQVNLAHERDLGAWLKQAKSGSRKQLSTEWALAMGSQAPQRLAHTWLEQACIGNPTLRADAPLAEHKDKDLESLGRGANQWLIHPSGTEGYAKAEVTAGGVDTRDISSQTMESKRLPGLHFIGEVMDVTGWLGGYNFQWAWASAMACAQALTPANR